MSIQVLTDSLAMAIRNTERANGATALHVAVENGHYATAELLLEHGALQLGSEGQTTRP